VAKPAATAKPARGPSPRKALAHLRAADPVLASLIDAVGPLGDVREGRPDKSDHYGALVRAIAGQQLSVKAARSIYNRLTARFEGRAPTPQEILADDPEELRAAAGFSRAKVSYLRSLAEHVLSGELELDRLDELSDEQAIAELVAVKGLGVWTAHMFLMFQLERPDVLPVGDLGIRRAIERAYGLDELPPPAAMESIAEPWRPHRTLACRYLWRSLENEPG
jgi:DNA-3-methyladenine glycosylase II